MHCTQIDAVSVVSDHDAQAPGRPWRGKETPRAENTQPNTSMKVYWKYGGTMGQMAGEPRRSQLFFFFSKCYYFQSLLFISIIFFFFIFSYISICFYKCPFFHLIYITYIYILCILNIILMRHAARTPPPPDFVACGLLQLTLFGKLQNVTQRFEVNMRYYKFIFVLII